MKYSAPALGEQGQELESNFGELGHSSKKPHKSKGNKPQYTGKNRLLVLESIAQKWSSRGLYRSSSIAMAALLGVVE